ncbi:MAG: TetR family transcriptional regulator, partial [Alphaproteobacteria bacterium]|nr:TetR family transcriptional regulator [Alphaproteobacteria bacterium]
VTIAHVSELAGMSRGIVNFYFTSKEKMLQEVLGHMVGTVVTQLEKAREAEEVLLAAMHPSVMNRKFLSVLMAFYGEAAASKATASQLKALDQALLESFSHALGRAKAALAAQLVAGSWLRLHLQAVTREEAVAQAKDWLADLLQHEPAKENAKLRLVAKSEPEPEAAIGDLFSLAANH